MIRHCHAKWKDEWPETEEESSTSEGDPLDDKASSCRGAGAVSSGIVSASSSPDTLSGQDDFTVAPISVVRVDFPTVDDAVRSSFAKLVPEDPGLLSSSPSFQLRSTSDTGPFFVSGILLWMRIMERGHEFRAQEASLSSSMSLEVAPRNLAFPQLEADVRTENFSEESVIDTIRCEPFLPPQKLVTPPPQKNVSLRARPPPSPKCL